MEKITLCRDCKFFEPNGEIRKEQIITTHTVRLGYCTHPSAPFGRLKNEFNGCANHERQFDPMLNSKDTKLHEKLVPTWYDDGKHKGNSSVVTVRSIKECGLAAVPSPTDIIGTGCCYGDALEDYIEQFDDYLETLRKFREEVLDTKRAYDEAISVDFSSFPT